MPELFRTVVCFLIFPGIIYFAGSSLAHNASVRQFFRSTPWNVERFFVWMALSLSCFVPPLGSISYEVRIITTGAHRIVLTCKLPLRSATDKCELQNL